MLANSQTLKQTLRQTGAQTDRRTNGQAEGRTWTWTRTGNKAHHSSQLLRNSSATKPPTTNADSNGDDDDKCAPSGSICSFVASPNQPSMIIILRLFCTLAGLAHANCSRAHSLFFSNPLATSKNRTAHSHSLAHTNTIVSPEMVLFECLTTIATTTTLTAIALAHTSEWQNRTRTPKPTAKVDHRRSRRRRHERMVLADLSRTCRERELGHLCQFIYEQIPTLTLNGISCSQTQQRNGSSSTREICNSATRCSRN